MMMIMPIVIIISSMIIMKGRTMAITTVKIIVGTITTSIIE